jgi:hypothetical protein
MPELIMEKYEIKACELKVPEVGTPEYNISIHRKAALGLVMCTFSICVVLSFIGVLPFLSR